ncbi:MAG: insulinase family protein [Bernardetiaceae bacterium]|nr:insulinase family protein [Bernardetiaceae bacterium]
MILKRQEAPSFSPVENFEFFKPQKTVLANGSKCYIFDACEQELTQIQLLFPVGKVHAQNSAIASFTISMLSQGTATKDADTIAQHLDRYGAYFELSAGNNFSTVSLYSINRFLPELLPLFCELLSDSIFPETELELSRKRGLQNLLINEQKNSYKAQQFFLETLFGTHPYGRKLEANDLRAIERADLLNFYQNNVQNAPFDVFVVGHVDDNTRHLISDTIGKMTFVQPDAKLPKEAILAKPEPQPMQKIYQEREKAMQSSLRIGKTIMDIRHPDYFDFKILNTILGGYFGSRLMQNLREEKGLTYGVHSRVATLKSASYMQIGAEVRKDNRNEACDEIYKEVQKLCDEPVTADELEIVKNYMAGSFLSSLSSIFSIAGRYNLIYYQALEDTHYDNYVQTINQITAERLQEVANRYLKDFTEVIVG